MTSRHLSIRIAPETLDRLDSESRRSRMTRSELAKTLLEEGLRMEAHPGIVFRTGPSGRRAGLAGGPDVWEVVRVLTSPGRPLEGAIEEAAESMNLSAQQVRAALRYYSEYQEEVDDWLRRLDDEAERARATWRREQDLLAR